MYDKYTTTSVPDSIRSMEMRKEWIGEFLEGFSVVGGILTLAAFWDAGYPTLGAVVGFVLFVICQTVGFHLSTPVSVEESDEANPHTKDHRP
jgi:hypothetical protein